MLHLLTLIVGLAFAEKPPAEADPIAECEVGVEIDIHAETAACSVITSDFLRRRPVGRTYNEGRTWTGGTDANGMASTADRRVWSRKQWTSGGPIPLMNLGTGEPMRVPERDRAPRILDHHLPLDHAPRNVAELVHVTGGTSLLSAQGAVVFLDDTALISQPLLQSILPSAPVLGGVGAVSGGWGGVPR